MARVIVTGVVMAGVIGVIVACVTVVHALHVAVVLIASTHGAGLDGAQVKLLAVRQGDRHLERITRHDAFLHAHQHEVVTARSKLVALAGLDNQGAGLFAHLAIDGLVNLVHLCVQARGETGDLDVFIRVVDQRTEDGGHVLVFVGADDGVLEGQVLIRCSGRFTGFCGGRSGRSRLRIAGIALVIRGAASKNQGAEGYAGNQVGNFLSH